MWLEITREGRGITSEIEELWDSFREHEGLMSLANMEEGSSPCVEKSGEGGRLKLGVELMERWMLWDRDWGIESEADVWLTF